MGDVVDEEEDRSQDLHTLCKPARSKCTSTFHKSHFTRKFTGKMLRPGIKAHTLREPAPWKCTSTFHKSHFIRKFTEKVLGPGTWDHTLCVPA